MIILQIGQMIHYSVTKSALIGLARGMAELTKATRVTVNSVLAGPTWTEGVQEYIKGLAASKNHTPEEEVSDLCCVVLCCVCCCVVFETTLYQLRLPTTFATLNLLHYCNAF
jgi:hypothetical protein